MKQVEEEMEERAKKTDTRQRERSNEQVPDGETERCSEQHAKEEVGTANLLFNHLPLLPLW